MPSFDANELPPENEWKKIEALACRISDPVQKLRFLKQAISHYHVRILPDNRTQKALHEPIGRDLLGAEASGGTSQLRKAEASHRSGKIARTFRQFLGLVIFLVLLCGGGMLVFPFKAINGRHPSVSVSPIKEPQISHAVHYPPVPENPSEPDAAPLSQSDAALQPDAPPAPSPYIDKLIWMVEKTDTSEFYSNRLEIDTTTATENVPRGYYLFPRGQDNFLETGVFTNQIKGILYHASESDVFAYRPEMTQSIREYSRLLVRYLKKRKAYHYFIDRFGKIYRLVKEDQAAFHSGNSIWADAQFLYLDLNHAFIGICFEGKDFEDADPAAMPKDGEGQPKIVPMEKSSINEAQLISGKELTDWLRVKYKIAQGNCIPHGLASVNPYDQLIGHHLDLSHGFPFDFFEISNKYDESIPAITEFGFTYDNYFVEIFQGNIWPGIDLSERMLRMRAGAKHMPLESYRRQLNEKFKQVFGWLRNHQTAQPVKDARGVRLDRSQAEL